MAGLMRNLAKNSVWLDRPKTGWLATLTILLMRTGEYGERATVMSVM